MNSLIEAHRSKYINQIWDLYNEIQEWRNNCPDNLKSLSKMTFNDFCDFCLLNSKMEIKQKKEKEENILNEDETYIINDNNFEIDEESSSDEEDLDNINLTDVILNPVILESYLKKNIIVPKIKNKRNGGYVRLKNNYDWVIE